MTVAARATVRPTGPVQTTGRVFDVRRGGGFVRLTLVSDHVPERARPGSFVAVAVGGPASTAMLPRLLWVYAARPAGRYGGTVEVVFRVRGAGTRWLADRSRGDEVSVVGPLGRPFPVPRQPAGCVLAGVEHGAVPLLFLAERLREQGSEVHLVLAGRSGREVFGAVEGRRLAQSVEIVAVDSPDDEVRLARTLRRVVAEHRAAVVYACGDPAFTRRAAEAAAAEGALSQVAIEVPMACGTGMCGGCPLPLSSPDGGVGWLRACVDGPAVDGSMVRWDLLVDGS